MDFVMQSPIYGTLLKTITAKNAVVYCFTLDSFGVQDPLHFINAEGKQITCLVEDRIYFLKNAADENLEIITKQPDGADIIPGLPAFSLAGAASNPNTTWTFNGSDTDGRYTFTIKRGTNVNLDIAISFVTSTGLTCNCSGTCQSPNSCDVEIGTCQPCSGCGTNSGSCQGTCPEGYTCKSVTATTYKCEQISTTPPDTDIPEERNTTLIWIILAIVGIFIIFAGVVLYLNMKKRSATTTAPLDLSSTELNTTGSSAITTAAAPPVGSNPTNITVVKSTAA